MLPDDEKKLVERLVFLESALMEFAHRDAQRDEILERHGIHIDLEKRELKYLVDGGIRWTPRFETS